MTIGIYKITSPSNKVYIGQSWNIEDRFYGYSFYDCKKQRKLYNSLTKYSWEKHKKEVICSLPKDITQEILNNYEILYWELYKNCGIEMINLREPGGSSGKHSEESKERMKEAQKGKVISEEARRNISKSKTGRKHNKQRIYSEEHRKVLGDKLAVYRIIHKEENRRKLSEKMKGRQLSEDWKNRIGSANSTPVIQMDLEGNFLKEWSSIIEAKSTLKLSNISKVCLGKRNKSGGFKWKYKN
jgi:group I intron endonuclease